MTGVGVEGDLDAGWLIGNRHGVDVVAAMIASGACPKGRAGVVAYGPIAADAEAWRWSRARVALELSGWRGEDAATPIAVSDG